MITENGLSHYYFPFTPIIMKLHTKTPRESRMYPLGFGVKGHNAPITEKWFIVHNCFLVTSIIMKLHTHTHIPNELRMCPIDVRFKGQGHNALEMVFSS